MTAAEANRRQAEIWSRDVQHETDLMRPFSGNDVCLDFSERILAFCKRYGVNPTPQVTK